MAKVVSKPIYLILKGISDAFLKNDINLDTDKDAQKGAEQVRANETPGFIESRVKGVQDYSKTIPEEGRVVVKGRVNEKEALRIANEKAEKRSNQKGNSQKGISR